MSLVCSCHLDRCFTCLRNERCCSHLWLCLFGASAGKWHLGVNCESRHDHCHHPNNHGFNFFYGLPFTNFNDCKPGEDTDILSDIQTQLRQMCVLLTLACVTLCALRCVGLMEVSVRLLLSLTVLSLLVFLLWYVPFQHLRIWNCIVMRDGEVVEQPLNLRTLNQRLMSEAERFVER